MYQLCVYHLKRWQLVIHKLELRSCSEIKLPVYVDRVISSHLCVRGFYLL